MKVKAEGCGYANNYTARRFKRGWAFIQQDGTYLTPGIGKPMYYETLEGLWSAIKDRPKVQLRILCDECSRQLMDKP